MIFKSNKWRLLYRAQLVSDFAKAVEKHAELLSVHFEGDGAELWEIRR